MLVFWLGVAGLRGAGVLECFTHSEGREDLLVARVDFDGDGVDEYLVTEQVGDRQGMRWEGFRVVEGGVKRLGMVTVQSPMIPSGSYAGVGGEDFEHGPGIFTLGPGGGGRYGVVRVSMAGGKLVEEKVDEFERGDVGGPMPEPWGTLLTTKALFAVMVERGKLVERFPELGGEIIVDREDGPEGGRRGESDGRDSRETGESEAKAGAVQSEQGDWRWLAVSIITMLFVIGRFWVRKK